MINLCVQNHRVVLTTNEFDAFAPSHNRHRASALLKKVKLFVDLLLDDTNVSKVEKSKSCEISKSDVCPQQNTDVMSP